MQFAVVADSPGSSLHERSLKARNELISKLLDHWERLAEIQLLYHEPGKTFERLPQSIDCNVEDHDRYIPKIDDDEIDGDEQLLREQIEDLKRERAQIAKQIADSVIQSCREATERFPRARSFEARIMTFGTNGNIEAAADQKFSASALGELPPANDAPAANPEGDSSVLDRLTAAVGQLITSTEAGNEQLRLEKADVHQRYIELADKNMGMLDKFKELVSDAMIHAQLPPEHYTLETAKMQMRVQSQHAAMVENTKASIAHERQQTLQAFLTKNPNIVEQLLNVAVEIYKQNQATGAPPAESEAPPRAANSGPGTQSADPKQQPPTPEPTKPQPQPQPPSPPDFCPGSKTLRSIVDPSTISVIEDNMNPDHWTALSPLLSCTDEAEFRRHINALSAALSELDPEEQEAFRTALKASIPVGSQLRLVHALGVYGLRIV